HPGVQMSSIDINKDVNRYWTLTNGGTAFTTCDATFNWAPTDVDPAGDPSFFIVRKYDAPNWTSPALGGRNATSLQATGMTSFSQFVVGQVEVDTIAASSTPHGTISPAGAIPVIFGHDTSFVITPDLHYHIVDVTVDGASIGPVGNHAFTNVTDNHTIVA